MKFVPRKKARVYIVSLKGHDQGVEIHSEIHDAKLHDRNTDNCGIKHPVFPIPPYCSRNLLFFRFTHHFPSDHLHESILPFHQDSSWYSCIPKI